MKKTKFLMPVLGMTALVGTASPLVCLVGCTNNHTNKITFHVNETKMIKPNMGFIELDWVPSGDSVEISNPIFKYNNDKNATATIQSASRPLIINLLFEEEITESDINDGKLSFHYNDKTIREEKNITINKIKIKKIETVEIDVNKPIKDEEEVWWLTTSQTDKFTIKPYTIYKYTIKLEDFGDHFSSLDFENTPWLFTYQEDMWEESAAVNDISSVVKNETDELTKVDTPDPRSLEQNQYCVTHFSLGKNIYICGGKGEMSKDDVITIKCMYNVEDKIDDVVMAFGVVPINK